MAIFLNNWGTSVGISQNLCNGRTLQKKFVSWDEKERARCASIPTTLPLGGETKPLAPKSENRKVDHL